MRSLLIAVFLWSALTGICQEPFDFSDSSVLQRLSKDLKVLASDSFAGRESGTRGERLASDYIIKSFREAGLTEKGASDTTFLQPFPILTVSVPRDSNSLTIEGLNKPLFCQFDFSPAAYSANGRMIGSNYLLFDLETLNTAQSLQAGPTYVSSLREFIRYAAHQNYEAIILFNEKRLKGWETDSLYDRLRVPPEMIPVISVNNEVAEFLMSHRNSKISLRVNIRRSNVTGNNVIGFIDHQAPYTIIIGAHYDHIGISRTGKVFNGADDNASGTAMLMELARYLKQHGNRTNNYLLIAFSGEEEGLLGSEWFTNHFTSAVPPANFMINLDMVGRLGCQGNKITVFGTASSRTLRTIYKETPHPRFRINYVRGVHSFTDHLGFYHHHIPVISLTTGFHYEYHTTSDDAYTINYTGMVSIVQFLENLLKTSSTREKLDYRNISGWNNFIANFNVVTAGIDHILTTGVEE